MKLTILGSGTGWPRADRGEPGYLIEVDKKLILVDSGSGVKRQITKAGYDLFKITHIIYTHTHVDHVADLPAILWPFIWGLKKKKEIAIIGPRRFKGFFRQAMAAFIPKLKTGKTNQFQVTIKEVANGNFKLGNLQVRTRLLNKMITHSTYSPFEVGYRLTYNSKSLVFCGDVGDKSRNQIITLAKDCDLLVLDSGTSGGHLTAREAGLIAKEAGARKLLLTHLYPVAERANPLREARVVFKGPIVVARDLMKIEL